MQTMMQAQCSDILSELESWYASNNGQYLLRATRQSVKSMLDTSFGYHILQLGVSGGRPLSLDSPINHRIYSAERYGEGVDLVAHPDELPLDSDSIDTVIVHHCLEFANNPHQVLREIQRVLTPQGHVLIVGFNPYSLLGINSRVRGLLGDSLWRHHQPVGERRLADWLNLLGCEVHETLHLYNLPPVGKGKLREWMRQGDAWASKHNLPLGGIYILHATKQVAGIYQPHRRRMSRSSRLIGLVPKPVPTPTPSVPTPQRCKPFEKGDVAA
jgi:SAM-dependent methyltransferase